MHIVLVHVHVKKDAVEAFKYASLANANASRLEAGLLRFDVIQQADDPERFTLVEVYRTPDDQLKHRETGHYAAWRDSVAEMMAEPRQAVKYVNVTPDETFGK